MVDAYTGWLNTDAWISVFCTSSSYNFLESVHQLEIGGSIDIRTLFSVCVFQTLANRKRKMARNPMTWQPTYEELLKNKDFVARFTLCECGHPHLWHAEMYCGCGFGGCLCTKNGQKGKKDGTVSHSL